MRRLFALILVALLLGVGVVALIETDPGYLLLAYGDYTLESSLWVGLLLLVGFTGLLYLLIALLRRLLGGQKSLAGWLGARRGRQAGRLTSRGMVNYIEGNWSRARRDLLRGARNNETPLVNYLLAAQASGRLGEPEQVEQQLQAAAGSTAGAEVVVALTRAEIQIEAGHYRQAVHTLEEARRSPARYPRALSLLQQAYTGLNDRAALAALLPQLRKYGVMDAGRQQSLEREVFGGMLADASDPVAGGNLDRLCDSWHKIPTPVRQEPAMIRDYAARLVAFGAHALAEKTILGELKKRWDPELVSLYGYLQLDNVRRQLARAEAWLERHPQDPELLLCLGRLAARDKLWGKARDYFERSYRLRRTPEICAELGRLLSGLGEANVAAAYFREGLLLQEKNLPALPRPERVVPDRRLLQRS